MNPKRRHTEPAKLPATLRGDLDWIVMKCLEKDRMRRYDTANGLALDLQRHLNHDAITARPPTTTYLIGRLIRRNKAAFVGASAVVLALVIGIVASTSQAVRAMEGEKSARAETQRAVAAETNAHAEARRATEAEKLAGERLAESEQARKEALTLRKESVPRMRDAFGSEDSLTLWVMTGLAESLDDAGQKEEALKLLEDILQIYKTA